jgi:aconitate hydratase
MADQCAPVFSIKKNLSIGNEKYSYYALELLQQSSNLDYNLSRLPCCIKILLEALLRHEGKGSNAEHIQRVLAWGKDRKAPLETLFFPGRVLMQDFTGVPALVDLASMREALKKLGGDPQKINPQIPVDLVVDHSLIVDSFGSKSSFQKNLSLEFERNKERYQFLKWGQQAFQGFRVVPPGGGICHQVNLECLASGVRVGEKKLLFPDTLIGTDSHTTMVNALGVLGWGVGGIEAEAALMGVPLGLVISKVIGVRLIGALGEGVLATDAVLTLTSLLRQYGVVDCFVEFFGEGLKSLSVPDRATFSNMAPEFGATCAFFPVDSMTLDYFRLTGRSEEQIQLVETYAKTQGLWHYLEEPLFSSVIDFDLSDISPTLAGPKRPQDRVPLSEVATVYREILEEERGGKEKKGDDAPVHQGDVVIAAITSCTNTSNPSAMIAAGLLAEKAVGLGLKVKSWVKTSLAPGSQVVARYLQKLGLQESLEQLGFYLVGFGCTTCIGNSGPLSKEIADYIHQKDLSVAAVLSGNRNFEGRIHPQVKLNYLASPPLVVAYALAGNLKVNLLQDPLSYNTQGDPIFLKDLWPTSQEIFARSQQAVTADLFRESYQGVFEGSSEWKDLPLITGDFYDWNDSSTYIRNPPYFEGLTPEEPSLQDIKNAQILAILGDSITTDHISPAGSIPSQSPSGLYLQGLGVTAENLNSYGARRGNHAVMLRGTFANPRLQNEMTPELKGGMTVYVPSQEKMGFFEAADLYQKDKTPLVIFAGKEYGTGSSRDWAAKGTALLGVRAVIAESFERIHRSNLVGMGVLPLQFLEGMTRHDLGLTGLEMVDILGIAPEVKVGAILTLRIHRHGEHFMVLPVKCRIETDEEVSFFKNGGILPDLLRRTYRACDPS